MNNDNLDFEEVMFEKKELDPKDGYTFRFETLPIKNGVESFRVKCFDKDSKVVGSSHIYKYKDHIKSAEVLVNRHHRRRGIASAMYKEAAKYSGVPILPSGVMTQDGKALWGSFGKSEEDLTKGLKGAVAGAVLGAAAMIPSQTDSTLRIDNQRWDDAPRMQVTVPDSHHNKPAEDLHPHLKAIGFLESGSGRDTAHVKHSGGPWHTAYGELGFKPVSAYEEYRRQPALKSRFPGLDDKTTFLHAFQTYPAVYNGIANHYWKRLLKEFKDPERVAFAWRLGEYGARRAKPEAWKNHEYVRRFGDLFATTRPQVVKKSISDIPQGEENDGRTDYSHVLPQSLYRDGYRLYVDDGQGQIGQTSVEAQVKRIHENMVVHIGHADGSVGKTDWLSNANPGAKFLRINMTNVEPDYRRMGLGEAMYEAMMAHAKHKFKATHVSGGVHSTAAHATHKKIAAKHGLSYKADAEIPDLLSDDEEPGAYDNAFGPYKYTLR